MHTYINNKFVTQNDAVISVQDRGFRFGDGVFETIRVSSGIPYQWDLHIKRLLCGLSALKINADIKNLKQSCDELLQKNNMTDGFLRIAISRGCGSRGYLPDIKDGATIVIETVPPAPEITEHVDLWLSDYKKTPADCLPVAKTMQGLNSTLARLQAQENNCFEAVLTDHDGYICEGSSANIFWVKDEKLYTPSLDLPVLPGTIRDAVIRLSPYKVIQGKFTIDELQAANEVFLTNVAWLLASVKSLQPVGFAWNKNNISKEIRQNILNEITKNN